MVNIFLIKITNPQDGSVSNIGGTINMCFTSFQKINILSESHGDWAVSPTIGIVNDSDFLDNRVVSGMLGVL